MRPAGIGSREKPRQGAGDRSNYAPSIAALRHCPGYDGDMAAAARYLQRSGAGAVNPDRLHRRAVGGRPGAPRSKSAAGSMASQRPLESNLAEHPRHRLSLRWAAGRDDTFRKVLVSARATSVITGWARPCLPQRKITPAHWPVRARTHSLAWSGCRWPTALGNRANRTHTRTDLKIRRGLARLSRPCLGLPGQRRPRLRWLDKAASTHDSVSWLRWKACANLPKIRVGFLSCASSAERRSNWRRSSSR